jgi:DNA invertase Pin-like site-specific DNA recombinase
LPARALRGLASKVNIRIFFEKGSDFVQERQPDRMFWKICRKRWRLAPPAAALGGEIMPIFYARLWRASKVIILNPPQADLPKSDMTKFFLYARKSTDEPDRQVLSIEAQIAEVKEFALREGLNIVRTFVENQTAKEPGRPIFNEMLSRIEKGEVNGILAWHPDRLARNSVDGGRIIYLIDTGKIRELKFPTFWFENTPQGKFMLNIAFGQSKYYVDNLSENVKRGLRQKVRRGEYPGVAPTGYLNNKLTKKMVPDPERFHLVKKLFELYATGKYSIKGVRKIITEAGLKSRNGKVLSNSNIQAILTNPFYYGAFRFNGELYQGIHKPMIAKKLFDKCQKIMADRSRPKKRGEKFYAFRGLLKCAECGCAITSETQKEHNYYRCTKKRIPSSSTLYQRRIAG